MELFAQIFKVDEARQEVIGRIAREEPDAAGEIMDYETSKPLFRAWSEDFHKATGGQSRGNVRAMHGKVAAGKLTEISFNDEQMAVDVAAKIVDKAEWQKCLEGVYTGFSIGGSYAKRWADGDLMRYTAKPTEVSLVDNPCIKSARFTLVKVDGVEEEHDFLKKCRIVGCEEHREPGFIVCKAHNDEHFRKVAAREDVKPAEGEKKYGDVKFADAKNKKYPIDTEAHIRAAWNYINKPANAGKYSAADAKTIKAAIVAAWKDKIDKEGPPSAAAKGDAMEWADLEKYAGEEVWDASTAIGALSSIMYLFDKESTETHPEAADQLKNLAAVITNLKAFIASEIMESEPAGGAPEMAMMAKFAMTIAKAGARNSKTDSQRIQGIHDHSVGLGADCTASKTEKVEGNDMEKAEREQVLVYQEKITGLEKSLGERDEKLAKLDAELVEVKEKLAKLEAEPAPGGPVLKSVEKGDDVARVKPDGPTKDELIEKNDTLALIKMTHNEPLRIGPQ